MGVSLHKIGLSYLTLTSSVLPLPRRAELIFVRKTTMAARILAHDPGSVNYGLAVVEFNPKNRSPPLKFKVLDFWKAHHTLKNLKSKGVVKIKGKRHKVKLNPTEELSSYYSEVQHAIHAYDIDVQIAERYMSRRMGGTTIELVNMELGVLRVLALLQGTSLKLLPASQWKNEAKRQGIDLEKMYASVKDLKMSPHEVDAVMIGVYGAYTLTKMKPFQGLKTASVVNEIKRGAKRLKK